MQIFQYLLALPQLIYPTSNVSLVSIDPCRGMKMPASGDGNAVLHRNISAEPPTVIGGIGNWMCLDAGYGVFDASCGAGVSSLGHSSNRRIEDAMIRAMRVASYVTSLDFTTDAVKKLANFLLDSTDGKMARAVLYTGGSEAVEASIKMARQFFVSKNEPLRNKFITRRQSYHGATMGALGLSGHTVRRAYFEDSLKGASHISPFNPYRGLLENETEAQYIQRLADELGAEFMKLGPETVVALVLEPVVGAALGSVPGTPEYFKAMKEVCDKHGALLIFDEIMCGMGRIGTLHAWQQMGVVPDIQTFGKGVAAGFQPAAGMLISHRVAEVLENNGGAFAHGHTYQNHPVVAAAALENLCILRDEKLVENVNALGPLLGDLLKSRLEDHPYVGDIRGLGFKWGIEFVKDKITKASFDADLKTSWYLHEMAMAPPYQIYFYPGAGTNNGTIGDHIQIMPPFTSSEEDLRFMVDRIGEAIEAFFAQREIGPSLTAQL